MPCSLSMHVVSLQLKFKKTFDISLLRNYLAPEMSRLRVGGVEGFTHPNVYEILQKVDHAAENIA